MEMMQKLCEIAPDYLVHDTEDNLIDLMQKNTSVQCWAAIANGQI